jgi:hypothetical protein
MLVDGSPIEFKQSPDGVVLKVPQAKPDEVDRVVELTLARGN